MNYELFSVATVSSTSINTIKGLQYIPNYIDLATERKLIQEIDNQFWINDLKRRVQHYGYRYDYRARKINLSMKIGQLPDWAKKIAIQLKNDGYFDEIPDQVIVNEYMPGQGISPHIDCEPCFEDTLISLSLSSSATMLFTHEAKGLTIPVILE